MQVQNYTKLRSGNSQQPPRSTPTLPTNKIPPFHCSIHSTKHGSGSTDGPTLGWTFYVFLHLSSWTPTLPPIFQSRMRASVYHLISLREQAAARQAAHMPGPLHEAFFFLSADPTCTTRLPCQATPSTTSLADNAKYAKSTDLGEIHNVLTATVRSGPAAPLPRVGWQIIDRCEDMLRVITANRAACPVSLTDGTLLQHWVCCCVGQ